MSISFIVNISGTIHHPIKIVRSSNKIDPAKMWERVLWLKIESNMAHSLTNTMPTVKYSSALTGNLVKMERWMHGTTYREMIQSAKKLKRSTNITF